MRHSDYVPGGATLTFLPGQTSKTVNVTVRGDEPDEHDETFFVNLTGETAATIGDGQGVGTITDDDPPAVLSIRDEVTVEGDAPDESMAVAVDYVGHTDLPLTATYTVTSGTASAPDDFTAATGTVTIAGGADAFGFIHVPIAGDLLDEDPETFTVTLSNPGNATIGDGLAQVTIEDNDPEPTLAVGDVTVTEGNAGSVDATFTVGLSAASGRTVTVDYDTFPGSATAVADFQDASGTLTFAPGDTEKTITVVVAGDALDEIDETFTLGLSNPGNATVDDGVATGTITDDDALPALSIGDATVTEGDSGTTNAVFTVTLNPVSGRPVSVPFTTAAGTAGAADYATTTGTLTFVPGDTTETIAVPVAGDALDEIDEGFFVDLGAPTDAVVVDSRGDGTIGDDDALPQVSVGNATVTEGATGAVNASFAVSLNVPSGRQLSVAYTTENGTATAPADYTATSGTVVFSAGETMHQVVVPIHGDVLDEADDTFTVNLASPANAEIADGEGLGTITDDDALPALSINDVTVTEGNTGTTNATFTITLAPVSGRQVTVDYGTMPSTAGSPSDFAATSGTLTFAPGETTKTVPVPVNGDLIDEVTETYSLDLSNAPHATLLDSQGNGTILDDDGEPTLAVGDVTVLEGDAGSAQVLVPVTLAPASGQTVSVGYTTTDGSAHAPGDYGSTGNILVFQPGETSKTVAVNVNGDLLDEFDESFTVDLGTAVNAVKGDPSGLVTITDNDPLSRLRVNDPAAVTEGNSGTVDITFNVTLDAPSGRVVTTDWATQDNLAAAPVDYAAASGNLTFFPGETAKTVTVTTNADLLDEAQETFFLLLSNPGFATYADSQGVGTINDDDPLPALSIGDATIVEGNDGSVNAGLTVTLSPVSGRQVTVQYATQAGTASTADFTPGALTTLVFEAGETTKTISVPVSGDLLDEIDESFTVVLSGATSATLSDFSGLVTITDDDDLPQLSVDDVTVTESNAGTANATFTVTLTPVSGRLVGVQFATASNSATAPGDYATTTGSLSFAAGETTKTVTVPVNGDSLDEIDETFFLNLSAPSQATIADGQGVGTIADDDELPALTVNDVTVTEVDTGSTNATFTVSLSPVSGRPVSVGYATSNGSASAPADYTTTTGTLDFAAGQTVKQVVVPVAGDLLDEDNETFALELSGASAATIADALGTGTITDDDPLPEVSIGDATVVEGDSGTVTATFDVTLDLPSGRPVTVDFATADGSATSPADFGAAAGTVSFAAGQTAKTVTVEVAGDALDEADADTFTVNLTNPLQAALDDANGLGTIADDDALPALTIGDVTVTEGDAGTTNATFQVTLAPLSGRLVTVQYATGNGTAVAPGDYTATTGSLSFQAGETTKTVTVPVNGDLLDEIDESFTVTLTSALNATLTDHQGAATITDDDGIPSLSVNDVTVTEGNGGSVNAIFTVSLNAASGQTVTADFATTDGTATAPADYVATTGSVSFAPGVTTRTVTVVVAGDALDEFDEWFTLGLSNATNATIGDEAGLGTITDNDPTPNLSVNDIAVTEADEGTVEATFTVTLSAPAGRNVLVDYATQNGSAAQPGDYAAATGTLDFTAGETTRTVTVTVNSDLLDEINEQFSLVLANPTNAGLGDFSGTGTITDNDPLPELAISDVTVAEGDAGTVDATFTVTLAPVSGRLVTVNYATANGLGATAPADYTGASGTLQFAAGELTKTVTVTVNGDVLDEGDDTFVVNLSNALGATVTDHQGLGTITDDDATPTLAMNDVTVTEGNAPGTISANFTLALSAASGRNVTVNYATAGHSATSGSDFVARSGSLTFTPGQTSQPLAITVNGDALDEIDETYFINLSAPTNATLADNQGAGTIIDDDAEPTLSVNDVTVTEGNSGSVNAVFTVSLSALSGQTVSVGYTTADDTATAGADYTAAGNTLVFSPGTLTRTLTVVTTSDTLDEIDERFFVNLNGPVNAAIADGEGIGTITDNDALPTISVADVTVNEGNAGPVDATFTVRLNVPSGRPVSVDYATGNVDATAPADYAAAGGTLTFAPGETAKPVTVQVNGDLLDEANETFTFDLSNVVDATFVDAQAVGTITDEDATPALSVDDAIRLEGDTGSANAVFTVTLGAPSGRAVTTQYATTNGTAFAPGDYTTAAGTLTFQPGETTKTVGVPVQGDVLDEFDEWFTLGLSNPSNATLGDGAGLGTITDDDATPTLAIDNVAVAEGNTGTVPATFTVTLSAPSGRLVTTNHATADDSAIAPGDYTAKTGALSFAAGETTKTVTVDVKGDLLDELDEGFFVNLSSPLSAELADAQGAGTISDDDGLPSVSVADTTVTEGTGSPANARFTVSLNAVSGQPVNVDYSTVDGTAVSPADFTAVAPTTLTFAPGELTKTVDVAVAGDALDEFDEHFTLFLANSTNATVSDEAGLATITDDDAMPALSVSDVTVAEGDSGTVEATFTVGLGAVSARTATVDYATANGDAAAPGDYAAKTGTLSFAPGETSKQVTVLVLGDALDEGNETFALNLASPVFATLGDGSGLATITDDDPLPSLSIGDVTVTEGNAGTTNASFAVTLDAPSGRPVSADLRHDVRVCDGRGLRRDRGDGHGRDRPDDGDDHRSGQRRPARRARRDLRGRPGRPGERDARRRSRGRHHHRRRRGAEPLRERRDGRRGERRHRQRDLHGHAVRAERADGDRRLRGGQRIGRRACRLQRHTRHADLHARADDKDRRGDGERRPARRDRRDLHAEPVESDARDDHGRLRPRHDHRQRRARRPSA